MSLSGGGSNPDVPPEPPVECTTDDDCNDPSKPLCDVPTNVCKAGCKKHENCADVEYCDCDEGSECPGGSVGSCLNGCRDLGSSCTMPDVLVVSARCTSARLRGSQRLRRLQQQHLTALVAT